MTDQHHADVVRRSFERQVPLFQGPSSPFADRAASSLAWLEPLSPDMVVLDLACGAAHASEPVAPMVRQVVGIDLTPALLQVGAERLRTAGIANVLLQEANAESLPFVDESFDIVFCRASLHHFADPRQAVVEMTRVCRVGGRVVLNDLVAPDDGRDLFDHVHRLLDPSHVGTFTEPELIGLLPDNVVVGHANTTSGRLPLDIAVTEQSDREGVVARFRAEIDGDGPPTGFQPSDDDGALTVVFTTRTVQATREH